MRSYFIFSDPDLDPDPAMLFAQLIPSFPVRHTCSVTQIKLSTHFRSTEAAQVGRGSVEVSAREMAVPLGCGRDVEALLRQSAQNQ